MKSQENKPKSCLRCLTAVETSSATETDFTTEKKNMRIHSMYQLLMALKIWRKTCFTEMQLQHLPTNYWSKSMCSMIRRQLLMNGYHSVQVPLFSFCTISLIAVYKNVE